MSRIALLPAGGDPFLLTYWLRHYEQLWADEVDELRIAVCGADNPDVIAYIAARVAASPHASVIFLPRSEHGSVMRLMAEGIDPDDLILFCEDDAFVRHHGVIAERLTAIARGDLDVVGTARGNASPNLIARAEELFGPPPITASGETGLSLYPCFLFLRRSNLPDGVLGGRGWRAGDYLEALDYTCTGEEGADTFTYNSWELRARGLRIYAEAAYRSDSAHRGPGRRNVDGGENTGDAPWFHVGSLSTGYGHSFMVDQESDGYRRIVEAVARPSEIYDWQKRMSWWTRVADCTHGELDSFHGEYDRQLTKFIHDVGADANEIARWRRNYDPLVTWREA